MSLPSIPDPFQIWRTALDQAEASINSMASNQLLNSQDFAKYFNQYAKVSLGVQHVTEKAMARILERLDIPSRTELAAVAAAIQRIEEKLDMLLPESAKPARAPRPARTRLPPADPVPQQQAPAKATRKGKDS